MSYNIDSIEIVHNRNFCIGKIRYDHLKAVTDWDEIPEGSIFEDGWVDQCTEVVLEGKLGLNIYPKRWWWLGERSGHTIDSLKETLGYFDGEADLVLTWEGGDSHTGLRLRDGAVTEHEVVMRLGEECE